MASSRNVLGVCCRKEEEPFVKEFFEFFKTPWEFYTAANAYSAVISTQLDLRDVQSQLLVFYGAGATNSSLKDVWIGFGDAAVPIYGRFTPVESGGPFLSQLRGSHA